jgi:2'-5' RNA ligase
MRRQSAVFVHVPAEDLVDGFRAVHHPRAIRRQLPPHVTVIPPFWRDDEDDALVERLARHFSREPAFAAALVGVGRFSRHVWLAPEPADRFVALIDRAAEAFPALFRRDLGREPVPHLTVGEIGRRDPRRRAAEIAEEATTELVPSLPFAFDVTATSLYEVRKDGWHEVRRLPFA